MLHNNPAGIASREGSKIWACRARDNLLVSVGCGDMTFVPHGKTILARLRNAFEYRLSPAKEEELRALWEYEHKNYCRLDPKLGFEAIGLDNIQSMLGLLDKVKQLLANDDLLKANLAATAWKLVASSFFCDFDSPTHCRKGSQIELSIFSRLGTDVARIWSRWSNSSFVVYERATGRMGEGTADDGPTTRTQRLWTDDIPVLPVKFSLPRSAADSHLDVRFVANQSSASISGFPTTLSRLTHLLEPTYAQPLHGKRKRE